MSVRTRRLAREAERLPPELMSEKQYQAWIVEKARAAGWVLQFHVLRGRAPDGSWLTNTSSRGVPDLWLLRPDTGQLVVLEVKKRGGKPTPEQLAWVAGLQRVPGVEAYVVGPDDAADVLALLARPRKHDSEPRSGLR